MDFSEQVDAGAGARRGSVDPIAFPQVYPNKKDICDCEAFCFCVCRCSAYIWLKQLWMVCGWCVQTSSALALRIVP